MKKSKKAIGSHKTITIHDIAKESGVSPGTVSRYFHSPQLLKASTKERINQIIKVHNYIPNLNASALTTKQTMTFGLIIPTVQSSIHAQLIESIQGECHRKGYSVLIGNTNYSYETETKLLEILLRRRVSGIIHAGTQNSDSLRMLKNAAAHQIPSVVVWENIADSEISSIGINNYEAAYEATSQLIEMGHREIGTLIGPYHKMNRLEARLRGYSQCIIDKGLKFHEKCIVSTGHSIHQGAEGFHTLIHKCPTITAIFAASDVLAFGALHQAKQEKVAIPQDISIIGFDDIEFASYCDPPLTTVRVPRLDMGKLAVDELVDRIDNNRLEAQHISLSTELIKRESITTFTNRPPAHQRP